MARDIKSSIYLWFRLSAVFSEKHGKTVQGVKKRNSFPYSEDLTYPEYSVHDLIVKHSSLGIFRKGHLIGYLVGKTKTVV